MVYNLTTELDKQRFSTRVKALMERGCVVELTEKTFRTRNQNSYLHLLIGVVAMETGNTLEDTKIHYYKQLINPDLFCTTSVDKLEHRINSLRSSADLTKEEMATSIDRLKKWGAENGIYMPSPEDESILKAIEIELGRYQSYL